MTNHPNRSARHYKFFASMNEVQVRRGSVATTTFRDGPMFNNKLAPLGIETADADELIEHILRQHQQRFNRVYRERVRALIAASQPGDTVTMPEYN